MLNYYIPSYEEGLEMINSNPEMCFYKIEHIIDGYKIVTMNYKLITYDKFRQPVEGKPYTGYEMRGITYVFNIDGTLFKRYILMHKFFNLNQIEETLYNNVKDLGIKSIYTKEDGSITSFIKLPNGKVLCRSKMSFDSTQAISGLEVYNKNSDIKKLVDWSLDNDIVLMFEYVSPFNRIVIPYTSDNLILLRVRDNNSGKYLDIKSIPDDLISNIDIPVSHEYTLEELIELSKTSENIEGWVAEFYNGMFLKIKTEWYCVRHHIMTDSLNRENDLIKMILDDKIDDLLSNLGDTESDKAARYKINIIMKLVYDDISNTVSYIDKYYIKNFVSDRKLYVDICKKDKEYFPLHMKKVLGMDMYMVYKDLILKKTYGLKNSRDYLNKLGYKDGL